MPSQISLITLLNLQFQDFAAIEKDIMILNPNVELQEDRQSELSNDKIGSRHQQSGFTR